MWVRLEEILPNGSKNRLEFTRAGFVQMLGCTTLNEVDRANRPEGTRPILPCMVRVQGWPKANPPGKRSPRWAAKKSASKDQDHL
jgi:hypothetical protein